MKQNCWEFKRCGRQPQGMNVGDMGVCPAATSEVLDGVNDGVNAGRACWVVAGTYCNGEVQGRYAQKLRNCMNCDFYNKVKEEQSEKPDGYVSSQKLLTLLATKQAADGH